MKGEYRLRFFIDFPEGATRGDVELPADIFFTSRSGLAQVGQASGLGLTKEGVLNVKRERTLLKALSELGRSPKIQWGEAMFTVGLFTMEPIAAEAEQNDAEASLAEIRSMLCNFAFVGECDVHHVRYSR